MEMSLGGDGGSVPWVLSAEGLPELREVARRLEGRLRGRPEFEETLIVALTGWGQEADETRSRAAGFDHHLVKPADPEAILELLRTTGESEG